MPARKNMENLNDAIATIPSSSGSGLVIPKKVTSNGRLGPETSGSFTFSAPTATEIPDYSLAHAFSIGIGATLVPGNITELDLRNVTTLGAGALYFCCVGCSNLTTLRLDSIKYGNVQNGLYMSFLDCTGLTGAINFDSLDSVASGQDFMNSTFQGCTGLTSFSLNNISTISGSGWMSWAFNECSSLTSVSMNSLKTVSGSNAMTGTFAYTGLTSTAFLNNLTTISGSSGMDSAFTHCASLTTASLPKLTTVTGSSALSNIFRYCTSLTTVYFPLLNTLGTGTYAMQYCFGNCTSLATVSFPRLATIKGSYAMRYCFQNCTSLTSVSFPALTTSSFGTYTNIFSNMLQGCTGVTVHFPASIQSAIGSWADVTAGFGGTNTTVLFDL